ncbi:hypothetical protein [Melittangium boletus]|uniref:hypothetical protein n=1 Tax=Melittangium boletus TaxID=83453 RepID=UPI003DA3D8AA
MSPSLRASLLLLSLSACAPDPAPAPGPETPAPADAGTPPASPDAGTDAGTDAGPPPATGPESSRGSGKLPCARTGSLASGGQTYAYCVAEVAGVELKIFEPVAASPEAPLHLAVYLHGDGARTYTNDTAPRAHAPWAATHGTLYIAARALNGCAWWTRPSLTSCTDEAPPSERDLEGAGAAALVKVIEEVRAGWDILNDAPLLLGGSSGGSVFLTASFLPRYGQRYPAVYALACGGEASWTGALAWNPAQPGALGPTKLVYTYGTKDDYLADIEASVAFYRERAFPLTETRLPDLGHCAFDHVGGVKDVWNAALAP